MFALAAPGVSFLLVEHGIVGHQRLAGAPGRSTPPPSTPGTARCCPAPGLAQSDALGGADGARREPRAADGCDGHRARDRLAAGGRACPALCRDRGGEPSAAAAAGRAGRSGQRRARRRRRGARADLGLAAGGARRPRHWGSSRPCWRRGSPRASFAARLRRQQARFGRDGAATRRRSAAAMRRLGDVADLAPAERRHRGDLRARSPRRRPCRDRRRPKASSCACRRRTIGQSRCSIASPASATRAASGSARSRSTRAGGRRKARRSWPSRRPDGQPRAIVWRRRRWRAIDPETRAETDDRCGRRRGPDVRAAT